MAMFDVVSSVIRSSVEPSRFVGRSQCSTVSNIGMFEGTDSEGNHGFSSGSYQIQHE